jgi:AcrR family transcriptional regulator
MYKKAVKSMNKTENRRVRMTKALLKNSLIELMKSKPINKITIKELCENADVNKSTFYLHYTNQFELLSSVEHELLSQAKEYLEKIDSDYGSVQYLESLLRYIFENADVFRALLCAQDSLRFQSDFIEMSFMNLKQVLYLDCPENTSSYVYDFLIMGCLSVIKRWINEEFNVSHKDIAQIIFRLSDQAASSFN